MTQDEIDLLASVQFLIRHRSSIEALSSPDYFRDSTTQSDIYAPREIGVTPEGYRIMRYGRERVFRWNEDGEYVEAKPGTEEYDSHKRANEAFSRHLLRQTDQTATEHERSLQKPGPNRRARRAAMKK